MTKQFQIFNFEFRMNYLMIQCLKHLKIQALFQNSKFKIITAAFSRFWFVVCLGCFSGNNFKASLQPRPRGLLEHE